MSIRIHPDQRSIVLELPGIAKPFAGCNAGNEPIFFAGNCISTWVNAEIPEIHSGPFLLHFTPE
jgi:hypothetical protein